MIVGATVAGAFEFESKAKVVILVSIERSCCAPLGCGRARRSIERTPSCIEFGPRAAIILARFAAAPSGHAQLAAGRRT
jgi:hypothetical protein